MVAITGWMGPRLGAARRPIGDACRVKDEAVQATKTVMGSPLYARAVMAGRLPRVAGRRDRTSRILARTLGRVVFERLRPDERAWVDRIESRREELVDDPTAVGPEFLGEPESTPLGSPREERPVPIGGVAILLSVPQWWGEFLLRLVRELAPRRCLELGAAVGISTAYQAAALELNGTGTLITLEGARAWASVAEQGLSMLGLADRATVEVGPIDEMLPETLERMGTVDYAYLDASHTEEATVAEFDTILPHVVPGGIAVLDDISFTRDMWRAWRTVRQRDRVATSLALGRMGIVAVE
jgi:predicted O-methyltransferase YrrM